MIKFFNSIRRSLISKKRFSNYIVYALGEIVLVVIGILIALYINNQNESYKAKKKSELFLKDMVLDLASDTLYLGRMIPEIDKYLSYQDWLINKKELVINDLDSLKHAVNPINLNFIINDKSFQNIQNSGNKLQGYDSLYNSISKYYLITKKRVEYCNQLEFKAKDNTSDFDKSITKNLILSTSQYSDYTGFKVKYVSSVKSTVENFDEIAERFTEIATKNHLNSKYSRHNYINLTLTFCNIEAKDLIKKIEKTLAE
jgi:hypothetical protein